jgi:hypothetical protein
MTQYSQISVLVAEADKDGYGKSSGMTVVNTN